MYTSYSSVLSIPLSIKVCDSLSVWVVYPSCIFSDGYWCVGFICIFSY
nr:MAG TPA: hypothetical protein [Caudoviricetes sp.]